ncbi:MAG: hypothetical protein MI754_01450, partial [Chromatiales bacterium]|nr:hypothetical protein [Chromatiales bacterium]
QKMALAPTHLKRGMSLKKHHSALLVAYLEQPNCTPRALIGAFSGSTVTIKLVSTGPNVVYACGY